MSSSVVGLLLGLLVGLRHAFEPDHLTAVATFATEARDARKGAVLGAWWGLGHTVSLVLVGIILIGANAVMPAHIAARFELGVCAMLIVLGLRAIYRSIKLGAVGPTHQHTHAGMRHVHAGASSHLHVGTRVVALRPLMVGLVHGLAGSGALTALVFAELPGTSARVAYIAVFGIGSIAGMTIASAIVGVSMRALVRSQRWLTLTAGIASVVLGVVWSLPLWSLA